MTPKRHGFGGEICLPEVFFDLPGAKDVTQSPDGLTTQLTGASLGHTKSSTDFTELEPFAVVKAGDELEAIREILEGLCQQISDLSCCSNFERIRDVRVLERLCTHAITSQSFGAEDGSAMDPTHEAFVLFEANPELLCDVLRRRGTTHLPLQASDRLFSTPRS